MIRHVVSADLAQLKAFRLASLRSDPHAFGATYESDLARPDDWWERWARLSEEGAEQRTFVFTGAGDRWLGMALVRAAEDQSPGDAILNAMWVAREARGRGAARALCDACANWAAERGFKAIKLAVLSGNDAARRAYEAAGFTFSHRQTWTAHGRTLEELILTRDLSGGTSPSPAPRPSRAGP